MFEMFQVVPTLLSPLKTSVLCLPNEMVKFAQRRDLHGLARATKTQGHQTPKAFRGLHPVQLPIPLCDTVLMVILELNVVLDLSSISPYLQGKDRSPVDAAISKRL